MKKLMFIMSIFYYITFNISSKERIMAEFFDNQINIDVGFTGAKLLFFGVIEDPGDVVVAVTGPRKRLKARKKEKFMGVWINSNSKTFNDVPTYYYVAASKKLKNLDANEAFYVNQIGLKNIRFEGGEEQEDSEREVWKRGIVETMGKLGRYRSEVGKVYISKNGLFKAEFTFSSDIIEGEYIVDTLLLKSGNVIGAKRSFINVSKSGIGEKIYNFSSNHSLSYGIISVLFALTFGFLANEIIRRINA